MTLHTDEDNRLVAGRYRLAGKLGSGGMGVVWRAYDERLHRQVAVKQLRLPASLTADEAEQAKQKIMSEGRIAAKLQHPHAIMVYDVAEDDGEPFLVMEYLAAKSLADVLAERGTLPPEEAARIGAEVADALAAAHSAGVVHRDVKPGNILIGEDGVVKITDFGISRAVEDVTRTMTSMVVGTPAYLAPEVARGDRASFPSDVYSLGSTLYAAVEGQPPFGFADNAIALLYRVGAGDFPPPARAGQLTNVLMALLRADPNQRPTMAEASAALAAAGTAGRPPLPLPVPEQETRRMSAARQTAVLPADDDSTETAAPPLPPPLPPPPRRAGDRRRRVVGLAAAITALLAIGGVLLLAAVNREAGRGTAATQPTSQPPAPTSTAPPSTAPPSTVPPSTSQAAPPPPAQPSAAQPPSAPPPPAGNAGSPQAALIDYYALMPGNLQEAWTRLTPKYQVSPAGGFTGYQRWWSQIRSVQISDVTPISGGTVELTIVYNFNDGRVVRERHSYNLVLDKDEWLIDTSRVLSSVTL
ncbi:MAG TPA: serine/threonine-protein kinase [Pseudonocardiaceae bacterium]|nr:serine/threonine-protein kinase [Pseudonocardiaceae bacterium]